MTDQKNLPTASLGDTLRMLMEVLIPTVAKGPIIRRPRMVGLAERLDLDTRAVRRMQTLRDRYGPGPLMLPIPRVFGQGVVLEASHVQTILDRTPEPYSTCTDLKHGALSHFEPKASLISRGTDRDERRSLNEQVLECPKEVHHLGDRFVEIVREEAAELLASVDRAGGELAWDPFFDSWFRVVRRVIFGDSFRDDHEVTDLITTLRSDGNWSFFRPTRRGARERFHRVLADRIDRAESGSLAALTRDMPVSESAEPVNQIPQWLFAFDPAGMTKFRSLALLATHPDQAEAALRELEQDESGGVYLPNLRAAVLESLRLWPTTPLLLRQTTVATSLGGGPIPAETGMLIFAPFFHRDDERLEFAHRFAPEIWKQEFELSEWPLVPFSAGPGQCPATNVVLLLASAMLGELIRDRELTIVSRQKLSPAAPLPGTLNNYGLRFRVTNRP